ncbi:MAG TPA: DUF3422 domain-containing protein [Methyloprofundus sp.]|uniref:DUF3422 family protein n=1 Tax=Methyloprofundus sp. TaxID=2020875 RepID=UPI0018133F92|nr:DUF3422 domain-containing protein [Methyloprofundus sp.]HIG66067.1 DUF3422 domain-containing protein [Methyloprofundus sp.]HIL78826.1 DUF3422 domain-containing protein [Methylococcales bacterium]
MTKLLHIPENHSQRFSLHNEIHARPPVPLKLPVSASHLALIVNEQEKAQERLHLVSLCQRFGINPPPIEASHFIASFDTFLFHWEQHGEFSTYCFYVNTADSCNPFSKPALAFAPIDWLDKLVGQTIVAAHAVIMPASEQQPSTEKITRYFEGNAAVGAKMTGGDAQAFTDFRIHNDGFSRFIIFDKELQSEQAGRLLQRLFEIEIYRVMALLAFPISRELAPKVSQYEQRLSQITTTMALPECDDGLLLDQMTRLAAEVESHISHSQFRFGAAEAYYKIVEQRIIDIREDKIQGVQTIGEFLTKRMQPAINSCTSTSKRFRLLSERISNASQLLRTRVDISIEQQNQALLTSMDKRAKIQLRFQETVEGLSIVAITTYIISLLHSSVKAVHTLGYQEFHPDIVSGLAIPFVLIIVAISVRRLHKVIKKID